MNEPYVPAPAYGVPVRSSIFPQCLCWRAILAGVVGALGLHLLLSLIASGVGLAAFDPLTDSEPAKQFGIAAAVGWSLCALVALFFGGWLAGYFKGDDTFIGGLHGFLVWSVAMIVTFGLVALGGGLALGGMATIVGAGAKGAGKAATGMADLAKEGVKKNSDQLGSFLDEAMSSRPAGSASNITVRAKREVSFALGRLFAPGADVNSGEARAAVVKALTADGGMNQAEANKLIADWTESYNKLKADLAEAKAAAEQKAREAADVAARKLSKAAFYSFFAFWVGAILASIGGRLGARFAQEHFTVVPESSSSRGSVTK